MMSRISRIVQLISWDRDKQGCVPQESTCFLSEEDYALYSDVHPFREVERHEDSNNNKGTAEDHDEADDVVQPQDNETLIEPAYPGYVGNLQGSLPDDADPPASGTTSKLVSTCSCKWEFCQGNVSTLSEEEILDYHQLKGWEHQHSEKEKKRYGNLQRKISAEQQRFLDQMKEWAFHQFLAGSLYHSPPEVIVQIAQKFVQEHRDMMEQFYPHHFKTVHSIPIHEALQSTRSDTWTNFGQKALLKAVGPAPRTLAPRPLLACPLDLPGGGGGGEDGGGGGGGGGGGWPITLLPPAVRQPLLSGDAEASDLLEGRLASAIVISQDAAVEILSCLDQRNPEHWEIPVWISATTSGTKRICIEDPLCIHHQENTRGESIRVFSYLLPTMLCDQKEKRKSSERRFTYTALAFGTRQLLVRSEIYLQDHTQCGTILTDVESGSLFRPNTLQYTQEPLYLLPKMEYFPQHGFEQLVAEEASRARALLATGPPGARALWCRVQPAAAAAAAAAAAGRPPSQRPRDWTKSALRPIKEGGGTKGLEDNNNSAAGAGGAGGEKEGGGGGPHSRCGTLLALQDEEGGAGLAPLNSRLLLDLVRALETCPPGQYRLFKNANAPRVEVEKAAVVNVEDGGEEVGTTLSTTRATEVNQQLLAQSGEGQKDRNPHATRHPQFGDDASLDANVLEHESLRRKTPPTSSIVPVEENDQNSTENRLMGTIRHSVVPSSWSSAAEQDLQSSKKKFEVIYRPWTWSYSYPRTDLTSAECTGGEQRLPPLNAAVEASARATPFLFHIQKSTTGQTNSNNARPGYKWSNKGSGHSFQATMKVNKKRKIGGRGRGARTAGRAHLQGRPQQQFTISKK